MKKILVIDDDKAIRESLCLFFELNGFECAQGRDGQEGLDVYRQEKPDLAIIDYRMPKINGADLIRVIRGDDQQTPLILCSADKYLSSLDLDFPGVQIVKKPFQLKSLTDLVNKALLL